MMKICKKIPFQVQYRTDIKIMEAICNYIFTAEVMKIHKKY